MFKFADRFDVVQIHEELKKPYNATAPKDKKLLDMVFDIYKRAFDQTYPANNLANYDPSLNSKKAGVLTQLLWDRTKYVGCGYRFHVYPRSTGYRKLFCIFGPAGNVKGEPVYSAGEPNCEKESAEFPGLCVTDEAEQKFLPLPCEDKDFNTKYKSALCTSRSEVYKWIGKGFTSNSWVCNDPKYANYTDLNHVMCNESPSSCTGNIIKDRFNVSQFLEEYREEYDPAEAKDKKIFTITQRVIESAFDRDVYLPKNLARYYEPTGEKKLLADSLIQLLWDRSKYIGCGYWYRHHTPWPSCHRLLFCAFGPAGKVKGEPVYKFGKPSCERESKEFPGLCVTEEDEKKFLPLPCDDSEFNATYGTQLCTYKEEQSKRIEAENSCHDPKYEKFKDRIHVMCAETPASCPKKNIIDRNITDYDKRALVHTLNVFRSLTATGQTGGYPAALNMQQLIWDEELATLANKMSTLCNHLDQYDVSVDRFDVSLLHEEIIESFDSTTAKEKKILDIALQVYSRVFDRTYPARFLAQYNSSLNPGKAHGLTQLLWARIKYVGCGFRFHTDPADTAYRRLVCLFGPA
ncbi:uncharacterized protein LOC135935781 [Cloeon dipterum]|uniref:uncharacterized protein LOC135935781 n=1 Tax=Cloeon dipterum TaxID=197152 RepID=UPI00322028A0